METNSNSTDGGKALAVKPGAGSSGSGGGRRGGWGLLRLIPRVPLPGIPVPRLPLPGIPGFRRGSASSSSSKISAAGAAASLTLSSTDAGLAAAAAQPSVSASAAAPPKAKLPIKPASDVLAGALARALSQSTIHPLDTLKVRLQARPPPPAAAATAAAASATAAGPTVKGLSKFGQLVPPAGAAAAGGPNLQAMTAGVASLYKGVFGAASGAGIAIGAYFACYGFASNLLAAHTELSPSAAAFVAGGAAAAGSSVVKVPLAVCIRSVQAGVYPNVFAAASSITSKAGARGLFTGFFPTLLEDVPDMAVKFAAYESMRQLHKKLNDGKSASPQEDFAMGALAGALAAGATTPLDVIKTRMMCAAASRPTMMGAARDILAASGPKGFLAGLGARAVSNGINSAVFFCFFEALRSSLQQNPLGPHSMGQFGRAVGAWAAQARERAAGVPRAVFSSMPALALPLLPAAGGAGGGGHVGWATAGGWLEGRGDDDDSGVGAGALQPLALALPLGDAGSSGGGVSLSNEQQLMLLADASALHEDACGRQQRGGWGFGFGGLFTEGGGSSGGGISLSLLARASPLRIEHHSQIAMAMAALKGVEGSTCLPIDEE